MEKKGLIKSILADAIIVLIGCAYLFWGMLNLERTQRSITATLAGSIVGIICGILIKRAMGENGITKGYDSDKYKEEETKYNETCAIANPYLDRIDNYYACEEIRKLKEYRRINLNSVRLRYIDWFNEDGEYIGKKEKLQELDHRQKRCLRKCLRVKIKNLNLLSEYENGVNTYTKSELTDNKYRGQRTFRNFITAIAPVFVGVYFTVSFKSWNWGEFIVCAIQVLCWVLTGLLELYNAYQFITSTKVSNMRKKKEEIIKFTKGCEEGLYKENPYIELEIKQKAETIQALN